MYGKIDQKNHAQRNARIWNEEIYIYSTDAAMAKTAMSTMAASKWNFSFVRRAIEM